MSVDVTSLVAATSLGVAAFAVTVSVLSLRRFGRRTSSDLLSYEEIESGLISRLRRIEEDLVEIRVQLQIAEMKSGRPSPEKTPEVRSQYRALQERTTEAPFVPVVHPEVIGQSTSSSLSETDLVALKFLAEGPMSSRELERALHRSREHTARLLKKLFVGGYVYRDETAKPFVYKLTSRGSGVLGPTLQSVS